MAAARASTSWNRAKTSGSEGERVGVPHKSLLVGVHVSVVDGRAKPTPTYRRVACGACDREYNPHFGGYGGGVFPGTTSPSGMAIRCLWRTPW